MVLVGKFTTNILYGPMVEKMIFLHVCVFVWMGGGCPGHFSDKLLDHWIGVGDLKCRKTISFPAAFSSNAGVLMW